MFGVRVRIIHVAQTVCKLFPSAGAACSAPLLLSKEECSEMGKMRTTIEHAVASSLEHDSQLQMESLLDDVGCDSSVIAAFMVEHEHPLYNCSSTALAINISFAYHVIPYI